MGRASDEPRRYADRIEAGRALVRELHDYAGRSDVVVLGLARGGVPVAAEVARALGAPLDALVVHKLGLPENPELAMGAIAASGGIIELITNHLVLARSGVSVEVFDDVRRRELAKLRHRQRIYRDYREAEPVRDRLVILIDDGLATGSTMRAAIAAVRRRQPKMVIMAVPLAAADTCDRLRTEVDEVHCPWTPHPFVAVGQGYRDFRPTTDDEVGRLLAAAGGSG